MDDEKHDLLRSLSTIGGAQVNDKLDISGSKIEIHRPTVWTKLMRTFWTSQSVEDSIARVKSVLNDCFEEVDSYLEGAKALDKKSSNFLVLLLEQMEGCIKGLKNLSKTYETSSAGDDMKLYCRDTELKAADLRKYLTQKNVIKGAGKAAPAEAATVPPVPPPVPARIQQLRETVEQEEEPWQRHALVEELKKNTMKTRHAKQRVRVYPRPITTSRRIARRLPIIETIEAEEKKTADRTLPTNQLTPQLIPRPITPPLKRASMSTFPERTPFTVDPLPPLTTAGKRLVAEIVDHTMGIPTSDIMQETSKPAASPSCSYTSDFEQESKVANFGLDYLSTSSSEEEEEHADDTETSSSF